MESENFCNLIDGEHFGPWLQNKNFPRYMVWDGKPTLTKDFYLESALILIFHEI